METSVLDLRFNHSGSVQSEESALYMDRNNCNFTTFASSSSAPIQGVASNGQHSESSTAYFSWPTSSRFFDATEDRANYFGNLQKGVLPATLGRLPSGHQATSLLELMTIRAFHSKILRRFSLGTAIGFRIRRGVITDIPAILVFVARKVHREWLNHFQCLPAALEGPGGVWCDVDVVEFSYYGAPAPTPKEQLYNELLDGLRGSDPCIGPGSQVANQEAYGTLGAIVKSRTGNRQVGFLTNRHVAVDLDFPNQKMFHPLPPNLGPGVYLGAVERATSFITDELWYGMFAGTNPETYVRADGAFIPFSDDFDVANVTTAVRGVGEIGDVYTVDLQSQISSLIGRRVLKVGRSSGLTGGTIMAYALEYNDEKGICFLTDFLVVGENQDTFDLEGDSGSLIHLTSEDGQKSKPVGIIWGGTANRGRLKLKAGEPPVNWTSGVDLGRLLDLLELDLITSTEALEAAVQDQRSVDITGAGVASASPPDLMQLKHKADGNGESPALSIQQIATDGPPCRGPTNPTLILTNGIGNNVEHQFIPTCQEKSTIHENGQQSGLPALLRSNPDDGILVSLQLNEQESKRRKRSESEVGVTDVDWSKVSGN